MTTNTTFKRIICLFCLLIVEIFGGTTRSPDTTRRPGFEVSKSPCLVPSTVPYEWTKDAFPNPQTDINMCGRGCRKSWICDPNRILDSKTADILDENIKLVKTLGKCGCSTCGQIDGYQIAVAIVPKIELISYKTYTNEDLLKEANEFASYLRVKWNFGTCDDSVVIFISKDDKMIFTAIAPNAKPVLSINCTGEIFTTVKPILKGDSTKFGVSLGNALDIMVSRYGEVFQYGQCHPDNSNSTDSAIGVVVVLGIAAFIVFIIVGAYFGKKRCNIHIGGGRSSRNHRYHMDDNKDNNKPRSDKEEESKFIGGETGDGGGVAGGRI